MDIIRNVLMGIGCLGLIYLGSCAMVGAGTVVVASKAADKAGEIYKEEELKRHNERANRASAYHEYSDYQKDYEENYQDSAY